MSDEGRKHVKLLNIERRRWRRNILQLHEQLSSFSLNCCFLALFQTALASMSISDCNESISFCSRERSSVRTHVRLTTNDLCINYMASYDRERFEVPLQHVWKSRSSHARFGGNPKEKLVQSDEHIFCCHCGIWWSLKIMFPALRHSPLNLICIFKQKKSRRLRSALEFIFSPRSLAIRFFVNAALTASLVYSYQMNALTLVQGSFMRCRRRKD